MEFLPWKEEYSVNVTSIDAQHKRLIGYINELHAAMKLGKGQQLASTILNNLIDYTRTHFAFEESILMINEYADLPQHKMEHKRLLDQVQHYLDQMKSNTNVSAIELLFFLRNWLSDHILQTDKKYSAHLISKGVQ